MEDEATRFMAVDLTVGLHETVQGDASCELDSTPLHVDGHGVACGVAGDRRVDDQCPTIGKRPQVAVEGAEFGDDGKDDVCIVDCRKDFQPAPDDRGVGEQSFHVSLSVGGDLVEVEAVESVPEGLPFVEDAGPGKTCLKKLEQEEFVKLFVVMLGPAPFLVMVGEVEGVLLIPSVAAWQVVHASSIRFEFRRISQATNEL